MARLCLASMTYRCPCCGGFHVGLPDLAFDRPVHAWQVPDHERATRVRLDSETCVVDDDCFIRGVIEIPLTETGQTFGIGAWVSQKRENFRAYVDDPASSRIGPFFGWLLSELYLDGRTTLNLKTMVHFPGGNDRPRIELEPTAHPLAVAQRRGMSLEQAWRLVHAHTDPRAQDQA